MKKSFFVLAAIALIMGACAQKEKEDNKGHIDSIATLSAEYEEATSFNDSLMLLMGDIYIGLDSINTQEGLLYSMGNGENPDRRAEIRQNLSNIKARLAANRQLLDQMSAKLDNSNNQNSVLKKTIDQLRSRLEAQDAKIAQLEKQLDDAHGQITNLTNEVAETKEQVQIETAAKEEAQAATEKAKQETTEVTNELNKVYYAIGTNKELKKQGLLEKKFLGKTKVLEGDFNASYFTTADKRTLVTIPTGYKDIKIMTNMPAGSYEIVENSDKTKTLKITNPSKFWSLSNHLIIQVK